MVFDSCELEDVAIAEDEFGFAEELEAGVVAELGTIAELEDSADEELKTGEVAELVAVAELDSSTCPETDEL